VKARRYVLLNRDGTIVVEWHYLSDPSQAELLPSVASGLRRMREQGLGLTVVTNQSAMGQGFNNMMQLDKIHQRMCEFLVKERILLNGIFFCPQVPEPSVLA